MSPAARNRAAPRGSHEMPKTQPLHGLLDRFIDQFAAVLAVRAQELISRTGPDNRSIGRTCPFPGCKKLGAGPRNRWFCREHARSVPVKEQKRLLAARAEIASTAMSIGRKRGPNKGKKLDMHCRVEGCKNTSRGPRFGFICDEHRKKLSAKEQLAAREKWK